MKEPTTADFDVSLYCRVEPGAWHRVLSRSEDGVVADHHRLDFDAVWSTPRAGNPDPETRGRFIPWQDLHVPLPRRDIHCWGFALTYPEHRNETLDAATFRFLKEAPAEENSKPIPYREFLDYELEVGVLMHRDAPERFGYFLVNDLTDRGLQVEHYDAADPAPGFGRAKSFAGALRAGPLLAVGEASLWPRFTATLALNGAVRQTLRTTDCRLDPARLHEELFREPGGESWLVVATGTPGGTLFRLPKTGEKLRTFLAAGFSMKRARQVWLNTLTFLQPGDRILMESPILGRGEAQLETK